jgi:uncharacterized protein
MKIAIIADIHDKIDRLDKVLSDIISCKIDTIIICGDIVSSSTLRHIANTKLNIYFVLGNAELNKKELFSLQDEYKNLTGFMEVGDFFLSKRRVGITHFPDQAMKLSQTKLYDFIFYGHTHTPWAEIIDGQIVLNPGEIAARLGMQSTYAIVDLTSKKYELKVIPS